MESKSAYEPPVMENKNDIPTKLDPHGFPLRPEPSNDPLDPLNWPYWLKIAVLIQVSLLAFLGPFSQAYINSAYALLAKDMHISITLASYQTTIAILFSGVAPILWSPLANTYGRRPLFVVVTAIGIASQCAAAAASTWTGLLVARAFVGIGTSAGMGIGAAVAADMFCMHERGRHMGIHVIFVSNGGHVASIAGGFTALNPALGYRWCYWIPAMILAGAWLLLLVCLPETLYNRHASPQDPDVQKSSWRSLFFFRSALHARRLEAADFGHVFIMLKYPSILLPLIYYAISYGLADVLFAVSGAAAFGSVYHFDTAQIGMAIGLPTLIGAVIGELSAGPVSDRILMIQTKRSGGGFKPEARLQAIWPGFFLCPLGVAIEGVTLQYQTH